MEVVRAIARRDEPVLTAQEVADELDMSRQGAYSRLQEAHEAGRVERKKIGARAVIWWVAH